MFCMSIVRRMFLNMSFAVSRKKCLYKTSFGTNNVDMKRVVVSTTHLYIIIVINIVIIIISIIIIIIIIIILSASQTQANELFCLCLV